MKIVAIDIGKDGGICIRNGNAIQTSIMPLVRGTRDVDYKKIASLIYLNKDALFCFEKLHSIFGSSTKNTWSLAEQYGSIKAMCIAFGVKWEEIPPKKWQGQFFSAVVMGKKHSSLKGGITNDTKSAALEVFKIMFPKSQHLALPTKAHKVPHDGVIDAILISQFAKINLIEKYQK